MRLPVSVAAPLALAALLFAPLGAGATTLLSISGSGDLRGSRPPVRSRSRPTGST
jgi:hypothetical protein